MARPSTAEASEIEAEENQVTRPSDLGFGTREIEVEPIQEAPSPVDQSGFVVIRMAETIEDFTYGNPHYSYKLEAGKQYRMPVDVARYLHNLGKLYHRG